MSRESNLKKQEVQFILTPYSLLKAKIMKHNNKYISLRFLQIVSVFTVFSFLSFFVLTPSVNAQSKEDVVGQVKTDCEKEVKKAKSECGDAAKRAANKASHNCEAKKVKVPQSCIRAKAGAYITRAAKGNPTPNKFKDALKNVLDKESGSSTEFSAVVDLSKGASSKSASAFGQSNKKYQCGGVDSDPVETSFNFGCLGASAPNDMNPITDLILSFVRFFSAGVGLIVVASIIVAGIQYSSSEGNPEATQAAKSRVRNALIGLIIYIFGFAIIQFLVPGGLFT